MSQHEPESNKPSLLRVIGSALSAVFGVQSEQNRLRDFQHGSPKVFVLTGIMTIITFVLAIYLVVRLVLSAAGA